MEKSKLELTITTFVTADFRYCPFICMLHDRKFYNKMNKIHESALRIIHKDSMSGFEGLVVKSNSGCVHQRNLQPLLIEICKTINNLNLSFMAEVFVTNVVPYNLHGSTNLVYPKLGQICMALILSGLLAKSYGRLCRKKLKSPKH